MMTERRTLQIPKCGNRNWSVDEDAFLHECYATMSRKFGPPSPGWGVAQAIAAAHWMRQGTDTEKKHRVWSDEELVILDTHFVYMGERITHLLPGLSRKQILRKARELGFVVVQPRAYGVRLTELPPKPPRDLLQGGPYTPSGKPGDVVADYTGKPCKIVGMTNAPVSWPVYRHMGSRSPLLMTDELIRAIRTERAITMEYLFGVSKTTVHHLQSLFKPLLDGN